MTTSSASSETGRRSTVLIAAGAFVLVLIIWQTQTLEVLLYPLRLLVSLIHELGHGLTAILTGGRFLGFEVYPNGAGLAHLQGGSAFLTPQMGYLGAGLCGAVLLALTNRVRDVRWVAYGLALLIGGCVVLFTHAASVLLPALAIGGVAWAVGGALPRYRVPIRLITVACVALSLAVAWTEVAVRIGLIAAALLALLGMFGRRSLTVFVLNFLALVIGLNAIADIWLLFGSPGASLGVYPNDAAAMANVTGLPTVFWVALWAVLVIGMMGIAFYVAFIQPLRRRFTSPPQSPSP